MLWQTEILQFQKIVDIVIKTCLLYIYWTSLHILVLWGLKRVIVYTYFSFIFEMYYCIKAKMTDFFKNPSVFSRTEKQKKSWGLGIERNFIQRIEFDLKTARETRIFNIQSNSTRGMFKSLLQKTSPVTSVKKGCKGENNKWVES